MWTYGALSQNQQSFATKAKFCADCGSLALRGNNILAHAEAQRPAADARGSLGVVARVTVIQYLTDFEKGVEDSFIWTAQQVLTTLQERSNYTPTTSLCHVHPLRFPKDLRSLVFSLSG